MNFSLAIDDILAEELCKFRINQQCDIDMVERTLHYYKGYPIFTKSYFRQYYSNAIQTNLLQSISTINWDSIETISKGTIYKVILSSQKNVNFPYISIYDDKIENNFTATFMKDDRQKAKEHLKALLENAKCIFVYDLYLFNNNVWKSFIDFAQQCFPNKQLNIFYPQSIVAGQNIQSQCSQIVQNNSQWSFSPDRTHQNFTNLHDRYLIIDNKIEIILTSGIDNLIDDSKDFTYIVRQHKQ